MVGKTAPEPRKGMPSPQLGEAEFKRRFKSQFQDAAFESLQEALEQVADAAWTAYDEGSKSPRTRKAGPGFADPDYELSTDWLRTRDEIRRAQQRHDDPAGPFRILLINGSSRSEHTCPGEMSKSWRLLQIARESIAAEASFVVECLDLSRLASEYGRRIHPCKACFSTSAALCHWPCSCYPNYAIGQTQDWMNEIYPLWVEAHGILIVTPVNWYQATSSLKLMIDRLVCADGGNPDPTLTHGKDPKRAKKVELEGWDYPRHLKGRIFGLVVHGDAEGIEPLGHALADWLRSMHLRSAGENAELRRYVGYWKPYAISHDELDADLAVQEEVRNVARTLMEAIKADRAGRFVKPGEALTEPREK